MRIKKFCVLAGVIALVSLAWASPVAADGHLQSITVDPQAVDAVEGDVTVTVTGANWDPPVPFFITACPGAGGDPTALTSVPAVLASCPNVAADARDVAWDGGSFSTEVTLTIGQGDIDAGALVILAGWLSATASTNPEDGHFAITVLAVAAASDEMMGDDDGGDEMGSDDETGPDPDREVADGPEEEMAAEEPAEEAPAEEPAEEAPAEEKTLPDTGAESGLLAVIGVSILAAGLLVIGAGRRVRAATR